MVKLLITLFRLFKYIYVNESNKGQRIFRFMLLPLWQLYKRIVGLPIVVTLENQRQFIADPKSGNSTGVIYTRLYEPEYTLFLQRYFKKNPPKVAIDIGAHVGLFSLQLAHFFTDIHCFEPAPDTFKFLQRNININQPSNMHAYSTAISDFVGKSCFTITGPLSGMNQLVEGTSLITEGKQIIVNTTTLDKFFSGSNDYKCISFLKIDTEGNEGKVLMGARDLITNNPDILILIENNKNPEIDKLCAGLKLKKYAVTNKGFISQNDINCEDAYNIVLTQVPVTKLMNI